MMYLLQPIDITDDTTSGAPWWVVIVAALVAAVGSVLTVWATRRRDKVTAEQTMIDQLQETTEGLRRDLDQLTAEVRILRIREIAWITHTSTLTQIVAMAGQPVPPLPEELRAPLPLVDQHKES